MAQSQFIKDFDARTIVNVGPVDVAPCTCVAKPFTFPEFRSDERWGRGPAAPLWPGPRPERERATLAFEAADLAAHIDESVMRAFEGNPVDAFRIAMVAGAGIGVQIDEANTLSWFVLAATLHADRAAPTLVAYRVLQGIGVAADPVTAAQWFRIGADLGDPNAMIALGLLYATGKGVGLNLSTAVRWWTLAGGHPMAKRLLGDAYACGLGVEQDLKRAVSLYREAPNRFGLSSPGATIQLARMYRDACGVEGDDNEAIRLFTDDASAGNPEAQIELAEMMITVGLPPNQAYAWASFASLRLPRGALRDRAERVRRFAGTRMTADAHRIADELVAATMAVGRPDPALIAQGPEK